MVILALCFEMTWHHTTHNAENSYRYGKVESIVLMQRAKSMSSPFGTVKNLQLVRELANRTGGEFMTLGFLASVVYFFRQVGGFKWLAEVSVDTEWPSPKTDMDWLHLAEDVHMNLFFAMVFYFVLTQRLVVGAVHRIQLWEHCRLKRIIPNFDDIPGIPHFPVSQEDMNEHSLWRRYFMLKMVRWQKKRPAVFKRLVATLNLDVEDEDFSDKFYKLLDTDFSFSAYLAVAIEQGVRDSIQVHRSTWLVLLAVLGVFATLNRFARVALPNIVYGLAVVAAICALLMRFLVRRTRTSMSERACSTDSSQRATETETSWAQGMASTTTDFGRKGHVQRLRRKLRERHRTSLFMTRMLQVVLFLISYVFSRMMLDFSGWAAHFEVSLLTSVLFVLFFALLAYDLPRSVPLFLGVMSLPPHMSYKQFKLFGAVLLQGREASYQKELADLKAKLLETGSGELSENGDELEVVPASSNLNDIFESPTPDHTPSRQYPAAPQQFFPERQISDEAPHAQTASAWRCFPMISGRKEATTVKKTRSSGGNRLLLEFGDLFRTFIALGRQRGLDNQELITGLALHLGMPGQAQGLTRVANFGETGGTGETGGSGEAGRGSRTKPISEDTGPTYRSESSSGGSADGEEASPAAKLGELAAVREEIFMDCDME
eukprot:CAMPEP_0176052398 /NCGR_PEP_ID=MMETSP0120_2-20121206/26052_1 /TAXON_ID=160619 /ORGANISM="Kryptoperidinium foliaceum, Strain CCMP 1326" /LENGTH=659 /DNA_ID=CAMNT_0017385837 /DNA_START=21 /DNA_END=1997 /DNA_ORIENTATION=-